jgi:hypothetical protein
MRRGKGELGSQTGWRVESGEMVRSFRRCGVVVNFHEGKALF